MKEDIILTDKQISVIVPIYNCKTYLNRCLDSLICQTYNNLQIILVDDGSTDGSSEICDKYGSEDKRIRVIHQKNGGVGKARNAGLNVARGQWVAFVDSDDWIHSKYFEVMMHCREAYNADIVMCRSLRVTDTIEEGKIDTTKIEYHCLTEKEILFDTTAKACVWGRMYKRTLLHNIKFLEDTNLGEDTCFNMMTIFSSESCKCVMVEEPMYFYYVAREDSLVHTSNYSKFVSVGLAYLERAKAFEGNKNLQKFWCIQAGKALLACRYLNKFSKNRKSICKECNRYLGECLKIMRKQNKEGLLKFIILYRIPLLYRLYRICDDKTMRAWEKSQRKKC